MNNKDNYYIIKEKYYAMLHAGFAEADCRRFIDENSMIKWSDVQMPNCAKEIKK
ncbi:MAG TPA: hypothetical protein VJK30_07310 [Coxiellaceae bacterium]|nr:hypothetical protein [Coxiellaceae bacterium]